MQVRVNAQFGVCAQHQRHLHHGQIAHPRQLAPSSCAINHITLAASEAAASQQISGQLDVYAVSDLHTDYADNMRWVEQLPPAVTHTAGAAVTTVLLVAGDVSDDLGTLRATLLCLTQKFTHVMFTPGNHELWVKRPGTAANGGATDSIQKLHKVLALCDELGVVTRPTQLGDVWLVPVLSWHHKAFDQEPDISGIPAATGLTITDYAACKWPETVPGAASPGADAVAAWFDQVNEQLHPEWAQLKERHQQREQQQQLGSAPCTTAGSTPGSTSGTTVGSTPATAPGTPSDNLTSGSCTTHAVGGCSSSTSGSPSVISFSHFLPHQHLLPEKRFLTYPNLAKAVGSTYLWSRLQQLQPSVHIFGHSHFAWDMTLSGTRFIQAPLCYPAERLHRPKSIVLQGAAPWGQPGSSTATSSSFSDSGGSSGMAQRTATSAGGSSSNSGSSSSNLTRREHQHQQQHQQEPPHDRTHDHHQHQQQQQELADSQPTCGLPVLVYRARYTAAAVKGWPQQQQQQQHPSESDQQHLAQPSNSPPQGQGAQAHLQTTAHNQQQQLLEPQPQQQPSDLQTQQQQQQPSQHHKLLLRHPLLAAVVLEQGSPAASVTVPGDTSVYRVTSWDAEWIGDLQGMWSEYYKGNDRNPGDVQLAPWVLKRYKRYKRFAAAASSAEQQQPQLQQPA